MSGKVHAFVQILKQQYARAESWLRYGLEGILSICMLSVSVLRDAEGQHT